MTPTSKSIKLQIWTEIGYIDLYLDTECINGFYVPEQDEEAGATINLMVSGDAISVKDEEHVRDFLYHKLGKDIIQ